MLPEALSLSPRAPQPIEFFSPRVTSSPDANERVCCAPCRGERPEQIHHRMSAATKAEKEMTEKGPKGGVVPRSQLDALDVTQRQTVNQWEFWPNSRRTPRDNSEHPPHMFVLAIHSSRICPPSARNETFNRSHDYCTATSCVRERQAGRPMTGCPKRRTLSGLSVPSRSSRSAPSQSQTLNSIPESFGSDASFSNRAFAISASPNSKAGSPVTAIVLPSLVVTPADSARPPPEPDLESRCRPDEDIEEESGLARALTAFFPAIVPPQNSEEPVVPLTPNFASSFGPLSRTTTLSSEDAEAPYEPPTDPDPVMAPPADEENYLYFPGPKRDYSVWSDQTTVSRTPTLPEAQESSPVVNPEVQAAALTTPEPPPPEPKKKEEPVPPPEETPALEAPSSQWWNAWTIGKVSSGKVLWLKFRVDFAESGSVELQRKGKCKLYAPEEIERVQRSSWPEAAQYADKSCKQAPRKVNDGDAVLVAFLSQKKTPLVLIFSEAAVCDAFLASYSRFRGEGGDAASR